MDRAFRGVVRRGMGLAQLRSSAKHLSASEIRKTFLDYFCKDHKHLFIRSSRVFSLKDPTLAFTNAGMNQFKDIFLGLVQPEFNRVANSQKCIRVGGTHNDLSQVGQDGIHHTFFEMLGNWSFGDYFKEEACRMSWDLLTQVYKIPPERLYVTFFGGDESLGLGPDVEVEEIWRKIGVKPSHILPFGTKHNFWTGNVTGPCGPCTEIHYDHSPGRTDAGNLVNSGTGEITELWNLVFTQFDRKSTGELTNLNKRFIDTGMGLERLVAVLQNKTSNYETDLFLPLFEVIRKHTGHSGYTGKYDGNAMDCGYRVLADHSRMIAVALSDGMIPNHQNKVRNILRKALTLSDKFFGATPNLLKELTSHVAEILSDAYYEIGKNLAKIHYIIDSEVEIVKNFKEKIATQWCVMKESYPALQDLDALENPQILPGLNYFNKNVLKQGKTALSGEDVFILFDTYGLPVKLTEEIALRFGLKFDMAEYLEYERLKKKTDKKEYHEKYFNARTKILYLDVANRLEEKNIQPTFDYFKYYCSIDDAGKYIFKDQETTVDAILCGDELVDEIYLDEIKGDQEIGLILDRTQLFCEENNQASDHGTLEIEKEITFDIKRLVKIKGFVIHFGYFSKFPSNSKVGVPSIGVLKLDENRRLNIMKNHTALHILNAGLRKELYVTGEKFSSVTPEKLSLNFMVYKKSLNPTEGIKKIEKYVKNFITHGVGVNRRVLNQQQFQALDDVVFIPGETILDREIPVIEINAGFELSREYCTGTHCLNTSDLIDFAVTKYYKGSYRINHIEAVTGERCLQIRKADSEVLEKWSSLENEISKNCTSDPSELRKLSSRVKQFSSDVAESEEISHLTKITIKAASQEANKNLASFFNSSIRSFLRKELLKAYDACSEKFVVHSLKCCWEFNPEDLEIVAETFQDKPLLMILKCVDTVGVQCIVPADFVTNSFSAKKWLINSVIFVGGIAKCRRRQKPDLFFFMKENNISEAQIEKIMEVADIFAKKNI